MMNREQLDAWYLTNGLPAYYERDGDDLLVNGPLAQTKIWVDTTDESLTPCLTGEIGNMPGAWENWIVAWHLNNLEDFDNYIDLGANVGYYSFLAAEYGLRVQAFEANPRYCDLIMKSVRQNNLDGRVHAYRYAMCDTFNQTIKLKTFGNLHGSTRIDDDGTLEAKTMTLDKITVPWGKTLVKMDVEGAEELVWRGATQFNMDHRPTYVLEWTPGAYSDAFFGDLSDFGTVTLVNGSGAEESVTEAILSRLTDWATLVVRPHD